MPLRPGLISLIRLISTPVNTNNLVSADVFEPPTWLSGIGAAAVTNRCLF
jgi:hypothetical protein